MEKSTQTTGEVLPIRRILEFIRDGDLDSLFKHYRSDYRLYVIITMFELNCIEGLKRLMNMGESVCHRHLVKLVDEGVDRLEAQTFLRKWIEQTKNKYKREHAMLMGDSNILFGCSGAKLLSTYRGPLDDMFNIAGVTSATYVTFKDADGLNKLLGSHPFVEIVKDELNVKNFVIDKIDQDHFDSTMVGRNKEEIEEVFLHCMAVAVVYGDKEAINAILQAFENSKITELHGILERVNPHYILDCGCRFGRVENVKYILGMKSLDPDELLPLVCRLGDLDLVKETLAKCKSINHESLSKACDSLNTKVIDLILEATLKESGIADPYKKERLPKTSPLPVMEDPVVNEYAPEMNDPFTLTSLEPFTPYVPNDSTDHLIGRKFKSNAQVDGKRRLFQPLPIIVGDNNDEDEHSPTFYKLDKELLELYRKVYPFTLALETASINNDLVTMEKLLRLRYSSPNIALVNALTVEAVDLALKYGATQIGAAIELAISRGNPDVVKRLLEFKPVLLDDWVSQCLWTKALDIFSILLKYDERGCIQVLTELDTVLDSRTLNPSRPIDFNREKLLQTIIGICKEHKDELINLLKAPVSVRNLESLILNSEIGKRTLGLLQNIRADIGREEISQNDIFSVFSNHTPDDFIQHAPDGFFDPDNNTNTQNQSKLSDDFLSILNGEDSSDSEPSLD